jgi:ribosomal RNA assembly protein
MPDFSYELKIPRERVAVLIGVKGRIKQQIEQSTGARLDIDSKEGDVFITGSEPLALFTVREIVQAIGRGFNPRIALQLLKGDYIFDQINLGDGKRNDKFLERIKGRIIGSDGKSRRLIEELAEADICVYGKTVGIIGRPESVITARKAIELLIKGSQHRNVYKWLESRRRDQKKRDVAGFEIPARD